MVTISGLCSQTKNPQQDRVCALAATRKGGCTRAFAADTFDLQQVIDGVHECAHVVANWPDVYPCESKDQWRIREVLLTLKLQPVMREICGEFFIFQQGSVPAHRARETINLLERDTCVHFNRPLATQCEPSWLQTMGRIAIAGLASWWRWWTEAALDR